MTQKIRRVVTHQDSNGGSRFLMDGDAPNVNVLENLGGLVLTELWETTSGPATNTGTDDAAASIAHLEPQAGSGGTVVRYCEFPPYSDKALEAAAVEDVGDFAEDGVFAPSERHPMMHKTSTVDYIIIIKGEIWSILEEEETLLKAGDILIQRGTNHAWSNRSDEPCIFAAVLVSAEPI
jgi:mannose-6-phosphate isomerase-like protein (cupin superfamily)